MIENGLVTPLALAAPTEARVADSYHRPIFDFSREVCSHLAVSEERKWLVTNGIGGYASGTIAGVLTRRYHGLLVAALKPPLGRTLLLTKLDETVACNGDSYALFANC